MASTNRKGDVEDSDIEVFRCIICMEALVDAHICPHCSKMCCKTCIYKWLMLRSQCPHCQKFLLIDQLVQCRWLEDVTKKINTMQLINSENDSNNDRCPSHEEKLSVYCETCRCCICHQCALWGDTHSGHTFKPIDEVYQRHVIQINDAKLQLNRRLEELRGFVDKVVFNEVRVKVAENEQVINIRTTLDLMISALNQEAKSRLDILDSQKKTYEREIMKVETFLEALDQQLVKNTRVEVISQSEERDKKIKRICSVPLKNLFFLISTEFKNELIPSYDTRTFNMSNFSLLKSTTMYSTPLCVNGFVWRLKVYTYPKKIATFNDKWLAVMLELTEGPPMSSRYECKLDMLHTLQWGKGISHKFTADFNVGDCHGNELFYKVDDLISEGYLNQKSDALSISFHLRPLTYYQRCREQQWYINKIHNGQLEGPTDSPFGIGKKLFSDTSDLFATTSTIASSNSSDVGNNSNNTTNKTLFGVQPEAQPGPSNKD